MLIVGYYLETGNPFGKADYLIDEDGAEVVNQPLLFSDIPEEMALICVSKNRAFESAAFIFDESEFRDFTLPNDHRPKTWLLMDLAKAKELSNFKE